MKIALSLLSVLSVALLVQGSPLSDDQHWTAFKAQYARHFSDIESRKEAFLAAKARVDQHNAEADQGLHLYHREVTKFSIMTPEESKMYMGLIPASKEMFEGAQEDVMNGVEAPASIDLRTSKCMPAVQNQGGCGSCWAFSAIHNIDYRYCVKNKLAAPITFSPQNLVDCSKSNGGCNGGDQIAAYKDIIKDMASGVMTSAAYPYTGRNGMCAYTASKGVGKVTAVTPMKQSGAAAVTFMKNAIATGGSISVSIEASGEAFGEYKKGIFTGPCTTNVDHAVNAVGYGTDAATGTDYWIVRNSWGPNEGLNGYWLMKSGVNLCGIELPWQVSYPTV